MRGVYGWEVYMGLFSVWVIGFCLFYVIVEYRGYVIITMIGL